MNLKFKITDKLIIFTISLNFCFILNAFNFVNCRDGGLFTIVEEFSSRRTSRFSNLSENLHTRFSRILDNNDEESLIPSLHNRRLFNTFRPSSVGYSSSYFNQYSTTTSRSPTWNTYNRYNNDYFNNNRRPSFTKYPTNDFTDHPNHNYESISSSTTHRPYWTRPTYKPTYKPTSSNYNKPIGSGLSSNIRPVHVKPTYNPNKYIAECACKRGRIGSSDSSHSYSSTTTTTTPATTTTTTTPSSFFNFTSNQSNRQPRFKENFSVNLPPNNRDINTRIVNGTVADYYKYPWSVSLGRGIDGKYVNESHYCGGTLIAKQWVISAGHCLTDFKPKQLIIAYGSGDRSKMKHFAEVEQVVVHPQYRLVSKNEYV